MIVYVYAGAWVFSTNRRNWSNASRRYGRSRAIGQFAREGTMSGLFARQQSVNLTYSTGVFTRRGHDFDMFNPTRPLVTC